MEMLETIRGKEVRDGLPNTSRCPPWKQDRSEQRARGTSASPHLPPFLTRCHPVVIAVATGPPSFPWGFLSSCQISLESVRTLG